MPDTDLLIEKQIFLGGQISQKHKAFKEIALMSPDYAEIYMILDKMQEWEKETDEDKVFMELIKLFGMVDMVRECTELTKLSMVLGDTRERYKVKEE